LNDVCTHFAFRHKVFNVEGSYFAADQSGDDPCFIMPMGDGVAEVHIPALRKEFSIPDDSDDGKLLNIVGDALRFVKTIRVNDSIPNELIDGSASWSVEEHHSLIARGRLTLQVIAWVTGKSTKANNVVEILELLEKPEIKAKVKDSIQKLTEHFELGDDGVDEIERRIDILVHELSYIEALRQRLRTIHEIDAQAKAAIERCGKRVSAQESAERTAVLLPKALIKLQSEFELLDKLNQNIVDILGDVDGTVQIIREIRDEIMCTLRIWDDLVSAWQEDGKSKDGDTLTSLLTKTHRFLAEHYPILQTW